MPITAEEQATLDFINSVSPPEDEEGDSIGATFVPARTNTATVDAEALTAPPADTTVPPPIYGHESDDAELGFWDTVREWAPGAVSARDKNDEQQGLKDWMRMPEFWNMSLPAAMSLMGTMASGPDRAIKVLKAQYPKLQAKKLDGGYVEFTSSIDGEKYSLRPGLQVSDIFRGLAAAAPFIIGSVAAPSVAPALAATKAGQLAAGAAGVGSKVLSKLPQVVQSAARVLGPTAAAGAGQTAAIEGVTYLAGGGLEPGNVPLGAALNTVTPIAGKVGRSTKEYFMGPAGATGAARPYAQEPLRNLFHRVSRNDAEAIAEVAARAKVDPSVARAARNLKLDDRLPAQYLIDRKNPESAPLFGAVQTMASRPNTSMEALQEKAMSRVGRRFANEFGSDLSAMDSAQLNRTQKMWEALSKKEDDAWKALNAVFPEEAQIEPKRALKHLMKRAKKVGGVKNLPAYQQDLIRRMKPKIIRDSLGDKIGVENPTYGHIDMLRQDAGPMAGGKGTFSDAKVGDARNMYGLLAEDLADAAEKLGLGDRVKEVKALTRQVKGLEKNILVTRGKQKAPGKLTGSILPRLESSLKKMAAKGDASQFKEFINAIPKTDRREVVTSGLQTMFNKGLDEGELSFAGFSKFMNGMKRSPEAFGLLTAEMDPLVVKRLNAWHKITNAIMGAERKKVRTGRLTDFTGQPSWRALSWMENLYNVADFGYGLVPQWVPARGFGRMLLSKFRPSQDAPIEALDAFLSSVEGQMALRGIAARGPSEGLVRGFIESPKFQAFVASVKGPTNRAMQKQWVQSLMTPVGNAGAKVRQHAALPLLHSTRNMGDTQPLEE
jgi:hypothetical protein